MHNQASEHSESEPDPNSDVLRQTDESASFEDEFGVPFPGAILPPESWARTAIKRLPPAGPLDWTTLFGRDAPRVLEIGCGNGRFIVSSALRRPDVNHLGIDSLPMVIRYATRRANQRGLHNARLAVCDGEFFLSRYTSPGSLSEIHLYHPQPYRSPRDQHRRLLQPEFLRLAYTTLRPGGMLYLQTDNRDYWTHIQQVMPILFEWVEQHGPWPEDPLGRSRREIIARNKGLTIYRGFGIRSHEWSDQELTTRCESIPEARFRVQQPRNPSGWTRRPRRDRGRSREE